MAEGVPGVEAELPTGGELSFSLSSPLGWGLGEGGVGEDEDGDGEAMTTPRGLLPRGLGVM